MAIDASVLWDLQCGMYVVTSVKDGRTNGQIANTVVQVAARPAMVSVALNKENLTHEYVRASRVFAVSILAESAPLELIGLFGFKSGRDLDKLSQAKHELGETGCPLVSEHTVSAFEVRVVQEVEAATHTVFIGEVVSTRRLGRGVPMTYAFYTR
jgi:flavin reductase (DIM6/NTAB) family NADH-FMN oxidoreductase RutF